MQQYAAFLRHKEKERSMRATGIALKSWRRNLLDRGQITVEQGIDIFSDEKNKSIIQRSNEALSSDPKLTPCLAC
jgi:hypothetical protein